MVEVPRQHRIIRVGGVHYNDHEKEFETFYRMSPIHGMVYASGLLADTVEMLEHGYEKSEIVYHIEDAREMISYLARAWAKEKGYRVEGSIIEMDSG